MLLSAGIISERTKSIRLVIAYTLSSISASLSQTKSPDFKIGDLRRNDRRSLSNP